jgi:two-component system sensor histidine kinase HydH
MLRQLRLRYLWPVALISGCLVLLCAGTAISLLQEQATLSVTLRENIESHQAAAELEECLFDLITLLQHRVEAVTSLHERVERHLKHLHVVADHQEEQQLAQRIQRGFGEYQKRWQALPPRGPEHDQAVKDVARYLDTDLLRPCQEFEEYNKARILVSTQAHEQVLERLAWGLAGVGVLGAVAGLVFGFGVARGLSRSIHRLRVQIHDAEGMIAQPPAIVLSDGGDFGSLHEQVERLSGHIERVVQQLHEREMEVLRAEQLAAVGQLAAGVAHEIRNPLTSIKLLVQSGLEDAPGDMLAEDLRVMEREILRMEQSLRTFLDFARPTRPDRRRLPVAPLLGEVVRLVRGRAAKQGVAIHLELEEPADLYADGPQLHQVLVNLALNALDAMPGGGTLTLRVQSSPVDRIAFEVGDTGSGIAAELLPRLFRPFVSGKDTGCGLGLVISRRIVEAHGGTLTAANRPEGGAIFTVVLPTATPGRELPCLTP